MPAWKPLTSFVSRLDKAGIKDKNRNVGSKKAYAVSSARKKIFFAMMHMEVLIHFIPTTLALETKCTFRNMISARLFS
jgi:hypothetical protein